LLVEVVMSAEENIRLMKTLDDSWNNQDWDIFSKRHTEDVIVRWPGQTEPTIGLNAQDEKLFSERDDRKNMETSRARQMA
jgi:SnoaL-like polyketide cyclase